jgi:hypothetical protein
LLNFNSFCRIFHHWSLYFLTSVKTDSLLSVTYSHISLISADFNTTCRHKFTVILQFLCRFNLTEFYLKRKLWQQTISTLDFKNLFMYTYSLKYFRNHYVRMHKLNQTDITVKDAELCCILQNHCFLFVFFPWVLKICY